MNTKPSLLAIAGIVILAASSHAQTIVNWGGNYVTADQSTQRAAGGQALTFDSFVNIGTNTGVTNVSRQFNTSVEFNPTIGADYSGTNAAFSGGAGIARINSGSSQTGVTQFFGVTDNGTSDRIRMNIVSTSANQAAVGAQVLFLKSNFLNGGNSLTLSLDQTAPTYINGFSININTLASFNARFAVGTSDGKFYAADLALASGLNTLSSASITSTTFTELRLVDGTYQGMGGSFTGSPVNSNTLTNITSVGFVGYNSNLGFANPKNADLQVDAFSVTIIPEPSSMAFLGIGVLALVMARRRRA